MGMEPSNLALFWAGAIALSIFVYVILDGFDLGVGVLFGTTNEEPKRVQDDERDRAVLGRERDLACDNRSELVCRIPDRLRGISQAHFIVRYCCCCWV